MRPTQALPIATGPMMARAPLAILGDGSSCEHRLYEQELGLIYPVRVCGATLRCIPFEVRDLARCREGVGHEFNVASAPSSVGRPIAPGLRANETNRLLTTEQRLGTSKCWQLMFAGTGTVKED